MEIKTRQVMIRVFRDSCLTLGTSNSLLCQDGQRDIWVTKAPTEITCADGFVEWLMILRQT